MNLYGVHCEKVKHANGAELKHDTISCTEREKHLFRNAKYQDANITVAR